MYLAYFASNNSAKNKLEKAIVEYLKTIDRAVIQDEDFKEFTNKVIANIKDLCQENNRCKSKKPYLWSSDDDKVLGGVEGVNFYFYHSKKDYRNHVLFIDRV